MHNTFSKQPTVTVLNSPSGISWMDAQSEAISLKRWTKDPCQSNGTEVLSCQNQLLVQGSKDSDLQRCEFSFVTKALNPSGSAGKGALWTPS